MKWGNIELAYKDSELVAGSQEVYSCNGCIFNGIWGCTCNVHNLCKEDKIIVRAEEAKDE